MHQGSKQMLFSSRHVCDKCQLRGTRVNARHWNFSVAQRLETIPILTTSFWSKVYNWKISFSFKKHFLNQVDLNVNNVGLIISTTSSDKRISAQHVCDNDMTWLPRFWITDSVHTQNPIQNSIWPTLTILVWQLVWLRSDRCASTLHVYDKCQDREGVARLRYTHDPIL